MRARLLDGVTTAPTTGDTVELEGGADGDIAIQAVVSGTGAVSAVVIVEASNDGINWLPLATITLTGTTSDQDGFSSNAPWVHIRARLTAISGTAAVVLVSLGA